MTTTAGPKLATKRFTREDLRGKELRYLLTIEYAGRIYYLAHGEHAILSSVSGDTLNFIGGLVNDIEWEDAVELFSSSAEVRSVSLDIILPDDVADLVARGHDLLRATGELSLWIVGTTYETRQTLLRGRFASPSYGRDGEVLSVSIQDEPFEDATVYPPATYVVDLTTWPNCSENDIGKVYPTLFGASAPSGSSSPGNTSISRALFVDTTGAAEVVLIAHHRLTSTTAVITDAASNTAASLAIYYAADGRGHTCALVNVSTLTIVGTDDEFFVTLPDGGWPDPETGTAMSGAGSILATLLSLTRLTVDRGRILAARDRLNRFKIGFTILEQVNLWEFITSNLSPILPMSFVTGPYGLFVIAYDYGATVRDCVDVLDFEEDVSIDLNGNIEYDAEVGDLYNAFTLDWALRARTGVMRGRMTLSGSRDEADPFAMESLYCAASEARYGRREMAMESTVIYSEVTAGMVLSWLARRYALPTRVATITAREDRAWIERGSPVLLNYPAAGLRNEVVQVENVTHYTDGSVELRVRITDDPARAFRHSG